MSTSEEELQKKREAYASKLRLINNELYGKENVEEAVVIEEEVIDEKTGEIVTQQFVQDPRIISLMDQYNLTLDDCLQTMLEKLGYADRITVEVLKQRLGPQIVHRFEMDYKMPLIQMVGVYKEKTVSFIKQQLDIFLSLWFYGDRLMRPYEVINGSFYMAVFTESAEYAKEVHKRLFFNVNELIEESKVADDTPKT
jgi:hypothetical protein